MRAAVVTLSVGLAVGAALSLVALSVSIERSTSEGMGEHGADMVVVQRDAVDFFSSSIPESSGPLIAALPGVRKVASDLVMFAPIDHRQQKLVFGWPNDSFSWATTPFLAGRAPGPNERHVAVLGAGAAEQLHKGVGDAIDFFDDDYKIIGVADFNRRSIMLRSSCRCATCRRRRFEPVRSPGFMCCWSRACRRARSTL